MSVIRREGWLGRRKKGEKDGWEEGRRVRRMVGKKEEG
jgi:hypothetical protein